MHITNNCKKRINNTKLSYPIVFLVNGKACFLFFPVALHYIGCKNMLKVNLNLKKFSDRSENGAKGTVPFVPFLLFGLWYKYQSGTFYVCYDIVVTVMRNSETVVGAGQVEQELSVSIGFSF